MNNIWENLGFFVGCLKNLTVSKKLMLDDNKGFCVSTGCDFESWVFYPDTVNNSEVVDNAKKFFDDNKISFLWPLYKGGEKFLEESGLIYGGDLTAMSFDSSKKIYARENNVLIKKCDDYKNFALTSWQGFGGEIKEITENYFAFIEAVFNDKKNFSLYTAQYENQLAGTFLLTDNQNSTGIYYFSTVPNFRRKGVARAMMNEICKISDGKKILLQATPSGLSFYENFGFDTLFKIPVYSNEKEIF